MTATIAGLLYGGLFVPFVRFVSDESWRTALIAGTITGPVFGVLFTYTIARRRRILHARAHHLPAEQLATVERAASRGPLPTDPQVRTAATDLIDQQLRYYRKHRWLFVLAAVLLTGSGILHLIDHEYLRAAVPLIPVAFLGLLPLEQRRLRARSNQLKTPPPNITPPEER